MAKRAFLGVLLVAALGLSPQVAAAGSIVEVDIDPAEVRFRPLVGHRGAVLTVEGPDGGIARYESADGLPSFGLFDAKGELRPDGFYQWELRLTPLADAAAPRHRAGVTRRGDAHAAIGSGGAGRQRLVQSGSLAIAHGSFAVPRSPGGPDRAPANGTPRQITAADQVVNDDLVVVGSACVGSSCSNGESFNADAVVKLKGGNLRIHFEDASFPEGSSTNDWQITINDSASGPSSKFAVEDLSAATTPFTITAGAPTAAVFVDSQGQVGLGTATPAGPLHLSGPFEPHLVLEQDGTGQFPARTWRLVGNDLAFYVADSTSLQVPFHISAGAPFSSLTVAADGDVGVGTSVPAGKLHLRSTAPGIAEGKLLVENQSATPSPRELLELRNATGQATLVFKNSTEPERWANGTFNRTFVINNQGNPGVEFTFGNTGNLVASGSVNATAFNVTSDRNLKTAIVPVLGAEVLAKLATIPISTWTLKTESVRHIGPMAQDFAAAFGLGADDRHISVSDLAGVSLAAVQALYQEVTAKAVELDELRARLAARDEQVGTLQARLAALEAALDELVGH